MDRQILILTVGLMVLLGPGDARGANEGTAVVLHAVPATQVATCTSPQEEGFICKEATTNVAPLSEVDVYVYLVDADSVSAAALRLDWHSSWVLHGWHGDCQSHVVAAMVPQTSGGSYVAAFDCVVPPGEGLIPLGWLSFTSGTPGTFLTVGEAPAGGTEVVDCEGRTTDIPSSRWGSVGVSAPGVDGCNINPGGWEGEGLIN